MTTEEQQWPPKGSIAELVSKMETMSISEMDKEIKSLEYELIEKESDNRYLKGKIERGKERIQQKQREEENKNIPFGMTYEEFLTCMGWHGAEPEEYPVNLTIGEMNLLQEAVKKYNENEISKWSDLEQDYNGAYGYSEYNCKEISSKIRNVQLKIFESMGEEHIRHTQYHKNIGGTIQ